MEDFHKEKFYSLQLLNEPKLAKKLAYLISFLMVLLIACTFLPWTQNIRSSGALTALDQEQRPQNIQSMIAGRIEAWKVHEGDYVIEGDTILLISEVKDVYFDPQTINRKKEQLSSKKQMLEVNSQKVIAISSQINALSNGRKFSIEKAKNKVEQQKLKIQSDSMDVIAIRLENKTAKLQLDRNEVLYTQGLKSLAETEQKRIKFQETSSKEISSINKWYTTKQELLNAIVELNSIGADYGDKIAKTTSELNSARSYGYDLEVEISKLRNEVENITIRNTFYAITASQEGNIVRAIRNGIGENVKEGETVATILPKKHKLAAELFIRPMDMPLITLGTKVRLQFDAWPALVFSGWPTTSFGTFGGIIVVIDKIDTHGMYRILVVPDPEDVEWPELVPIGSGIYGWAMLNDVPIWYEIWRELNGFPPDYIDHSIKSTNAQVSGDKPKKTQEK